MAEQQRWAGRLEWSSTRRIGWTIARLWRARSRSPCLGRDLISIGNDNERMSLKVFPGKIRLGSAESEVTLIDTPDGNRWFGAVWRTSNIL